jgi:hypothetical protein
MTEGLKIAGCGFPHRPRKESTMTRKQVFKAADWMTPEEAACFRKITRDLNEIAYNHCVRESTLLHLAIDDVAITFLLVRRAEERLAESNPDAKPSTTTKTSAQKHPTFSTLEAIVKLRERLRKATREFEDYCRRVGVDKDIGLPDAMQPVLSQIGDTLERIWEQANPDPIIDED